MVSALVMSPKKGIKIPNNNNNVQKRVFYLFIISHGTPWQFIQIAVRCGLRLSLGNKTGWTWNAWYDVRQDITATGDVTSWQLEVQKPIQTTMRHFVADATRFVQEVKCPEIFLQSYSHFKIKGLTTDLPFKLAVRPVPVSANGGGDITAYAALWEKVQSQFLVIQKGVTVILIPHWHRGKELLTALWAGNAGSTGCKVPSGEDNRQLSTEAKL